MDPIITDQAPSAKPFAVSQFLTTAYNDIIVVRGFNVPEVGFSADRRDVPGVAEISSPLILANNTGSAKTVSVRIQRGGANFIIVNDIIVEANDVVYLPLNGQFLLSDTNDRLQAVADANGAVTAHISYTQGQAELNNPLGDN